MLVHGYFNILHNARIGVRRRLTMHYKCGWLVGTVCSCYIMLYVCIMIFKPSYFKQLFLISIITVKLVFHFVTFCYRPPIHLAHVNFRSWVGSEQMCGYCTVTTVTTAVTIVHLHDTLTYPIHSVGRNLKVCIRNEWESHGNRQGRDVIWKREWELLHENGREWELTIVAKIHTQHNSFSHNSWLTIRSLCRLECKL